MNASTEIDSFKQRKDRVMPFNKSDINYYDREQDKAIAKAEEIVSSDIEAMLTDSVEVDHLTSDEVIEALEILERAGY